MGWIKWALGGLGVAVGLVVVVGAVGHHSGGIALAQIPGGGPRDPGRYEQILAQKLGITVEKLREAQLATRDEMLAEAVSNGALTQEQADRIKNAGVGGPGFFKGNFQVFKGPGMAGLRNVVGAAAEAIGITEQQLLEGLRAGKSIAEIADENDVDRDDLEDDILDSLTDAIDKAQTDGKITAEQATRLKTGLAEHIDQVLDRTGALKERTRDIQRMLPPNMR